jgi:hypothetical protein
MAEEQTVNTPQLSVNEENGKAIAEALANQQILNETPKDESFKAEPFFKEEETEAVVETKEEVAEKQELNEDGTPKATETKEVEIKETPTEQIPEEQFVEALNSALNDPDVNFKSLEDIKALVSENKKLKESTEFQSLSQEERARIEVGREFGDFGLFDRVMGIDTTKLAPKEALKQVYFLDNIGKNPQFLEKAFEKEYTRTYEDESDEEFSKMLLENNGQEAIKKLIDLQEDLKQRGKISGSANQEQSAEDRKKEDDKWFAAVDKVLEKQDRITHKFKDGLSINIVMDAKDKQVIQDAMDKPVPYFISKFKDKDGNENHETLYKVIMQLEYNEAALEEARKAGAAVQEEEILKKKKHTVIETGKAGDAEMKPKLSDQFATNFRNLINS